MSSTNRSENKDSKEWWETPHWAVRRLLEELYLPTGLWLEPCAGNGRIIQAVNEDRPGAIEWCAVEVRKECKATLSKLDYTNVFCPQDFFEWNTRTVAEKLGRDVTNKKYFDVAILNPPFSMALEFVSRLLVLADHVVMLQRVNWVGSGTNNGKNDFLRKSMPDTYNVPNRIKFMIDGVYPRDEAGKLMPGDSIEYCWYHWGPGEARFRTRGLAMNLRETSLEERNLG